MQDSYIPQADESTYCRSLRLCTIRKSVNGTTMIWLKDLQGNLSETRLEDIINQDTYNDKSIVRVYSSGHIFLSEDKNNVFLVTTQKKGRIQHQFTGGSPIESENKEVIIKEDGVYMFDITKVRNNARIRTHNRTWVTITSEYNVDPLVDRALIEQEENGNIYYKLVCLMHFVVESYDGDLSYTDQENVIWGQWYEIDTLPQQADIAPNAYVMSVAARGV